jgi:hypothetical protein
MSRERSSAHSLMSWRSVVSGIVALSRFSSVWIFWRMRWNTTDQFDADSWYTTIPTHFAMSAESDVSESASVDGVGAYVLASRGGGIADGTRRPLEPNDAVDVRARTPCGAGPADE